MEMCPLYALAILSIQAHAKAVRLCVSFVFGVQRRGSKATSASLHLVILEGNFFFFFFHKRAGVRYSRPGKETQLSGEGFITLFVFVY